MNTRRRLSLPRTLLGFCFLMPLAACTKPKDGGGHQADSAHPPSQTAMIARPCSALRSPSSDAGEFTGVFVELAELRAAPHTDQPLPQQLGTPVEVNQVAGALVESSLSVTGPWAHCDNPQCVSSEDRITVTLAQLPRSSSERVRLTLSSSSDGKALAQLSLADQDPTLVQLQSGTNVVVTAYFVPAPRAESLKALHACKARPSTVGTR